MSPGRAGVLPALALVALCSLFAGCGGDSGPSDPGNGNGNGGGGPFTAKVDGASFASSASTQAPAVRIGTGVYSLSGTSIDGLNIQSIAISLLNINGPGTYPLGAGGGVAGGTGIYANPTGGWGTALTGDAGTITLTKLTESEIAGTFAFTATTNSAGATGTKVITDGAFDLPLSPGGPVGGVPDRNRNVVLAKFGDENFAGGTVTTVVTPGPILSIVAGNTRNSLAMSFINVAAPTVLDLAVDTAKFTASVGLLSDGTECCWGTVGGAATGTVTVTSVTASRMAGTFSFTIPVSSGTATEPLAVTNGSFDVGFQATNP